MPDRVGVFALSTALAAVVIFAGCSGEESDPSEKPTGDSSARFVTDTSVEPKGELRGGRTDRTIATVVDPDGNRTDFLENEVIVLGDEEDAERVVERHDGEVVSTTAYRSHEDQHLVRLGEPTADLDAIAANLSAVNSEVPAAGESERLEGEFKVSSDAALATLAVSAEESAAGTTVTPNLVPYPTIENYIDEDLTEGSAAGSTPSGYDPNPFEWANFRLAGVVQAWRLLALGGHVDPPKEQRVPVGILDEGFAESPDRPPGSAGPFDEEGEALTGTENPYACENSDDCSWHGQYVTDIAVGLVDNGRGAAGAGGPVGRAIMFDNGDGLFSSATSIKNASIAGARVLNASFKIETYTPLKGLALMPLSNAVDEVSGESLLVAGAGNDTRDISLGDPFVAPCQFDDVLCVGGTEFDSPFRHEGSNWGEDVDIWAPFVSFVGPDPDNPGEDTVQREKGTSIATPIVSGIAALVWKVDPWLTPDEVRSILVSTAEEHSSTVDNFVNAEAAVSEVLDLDFEPDDVDHPSVEITEPGAQTSFLPTGTSDDPESTGTAPPVHSSVEVDFPVSSGTIHWKLNGETEETDYRSEGESEVSHTFDDLCIPDEGPPTIRVEVEDDLFGLTASDSIELTVDEGGYRISAGVSADGTSIRRKDGYYYVGVVENDQATQYDYVMPEISFEASEWTRTCGSLEALDPEKFEWGLEESYLSGFGATWSISDQSFRADDDTLETRTVTLEHESVDVSTIVPVVPCDPQYGPDADLVACPDGFSTSGVETSTREIYRQISEFDEIRRIKEALDARLDELLGDDLPDPFPHGEMRLENDLSSSARQLAGHLLELRTAANSRDLNQWYSESARIVREAAAARTEGDAEIVSQASRLAAHQIHRYTPEEYGGLAGWYDLARLGSTPDPKDPENAFDPAVAALDGFLTALLVQSDGQIYDGVPSAELGTAIEAGVVAGAQRAVGAIDTPDRQ